MLRNDVRRFYGDNGEDDDVENFYYSRIYYDLYWNENNLKEIEQLLFQLNKNYKFNVNVFFINIFV